MNGLPSQYKTNGLPRGIDISSTLSELFMSELDSEIKKIDGIFFYARYVDDIIIIYNADTKLLENECSKIISSHNLMINSNKKKDFCFDEHCGTQCDFDFLGYNFKITSRRKEKHVKISIAKNKINKQKSRIAHALVAYSKDHDFALLKRRLRFLSGVVHLQSDNRGVLSAGNAFNYSELTDDTSLQELDNYVHRILCENCTRIGRLFENDSTITKDAIRQLLKISFRAGYRDRLVMNYSRLQAKEIKKAWIAS